MAGVRAGISGQINNNIVTDGLVWIFDPAYRISFPRSGTNVNNIISGSGTGTLTNNASWENDGGGSFTFDGTGDYIVNETDKGVLPVGSSIRTVDAWFKCTNTDNTERSIISYGTSNTGRIYTIYLTNTSYGDNGQLRFGGWSTDITFDTINLKDSNWHYSVMAYNGSALLVWLDGEVVTDGTWSAGGAGGSDTTPFNCSLDTAAGGTPSYFRIGWRWGDFAGNIGPCSVYNRVLSDIDVLQNYQAQKERFGL